MSRCHVLVSATQSFAPPRREPCQSRTLARGECDDAAKGASKFGGLSREDASAATPPGARANADDHASTTRRRARAPQNLTLRRAVGDDSSTPVWPAATAGDDTMDKSDVTQRIRQRMEAGVLPRVIPPLTTEPGWPASPTGHIKADTAIGVVKCAACDSPGAQVAYRFPDGRIVRFHGRCHRIWEEECQRSS
jgi:hypothetical protein